MLRYRTSLSKSALVSAIGVVLALEIEERPCTGARLVLGATFGDLTRMWLIRMVVLAVPAGLAAFALAATVANLIVKQYSAAYPARFTADITAGWEALVLSLGMAVAISLLLSLLLRFESSRLDLVALIHGSSHRAGRSGSNLRSLLIVGQVALAAVLFVAGTIVLRYWSAIENRDLGYRPPGLASLRVQIDFRSVGGGPGSTELILRRVFDRLSAVPTIRNVSASRFGLLVSDGMTFTVRPERSSASDLLGLAGHWVGPAWFKTIGARMIAGRDFNEQDGYAGPGVAIVNESFAQRVWPGQSAIGKRIGTEPIHRDVEVVGVVRDVQSRPALEFSALPAIYLPLLQTEEPMPTLVLRDDGNGGLALAEAKAVLREFGSAVKILDSDILEQKLARLLWKERFYGALVKLIVALAVSLAFFGIYANMRRCFALRRREMAVRMAMGASQLDAAKLVLWASLGHVGAGALTGAAIATAGARIVQATMRPPFLGTRLIVLQPFDPIVYASAAILFMGLGCLAAFAPIRENRRINLVEVLKSE